MGSIGAKNWQKRGEGLRERPNQTRHFLFSRRSLLLPPPPFSPYFPSASPFFPAMPWKAAEASKPIFCFHRRFRSKGKGEKWASVFLLAEKRRLSVQARNGDHFHSERAFGGTQQGHLCAFVGVRLLAQTKHFEIASAIGSAGEDKSRIYNSETRFLVPISPPKNRTHKCCRLL